jgi:predicted O-methyltransferase YrrM
MATFRGSFKGVIVTIEVPDEQLEQARAKLGRKHFDRVLEPLMQRTVEESLATVTKALDMPEPARQQC